MEPFKAGIKVVLGAILIGLFSITGVVVVLIWVFDPSSVLDALNMAPAGVFSPPTEENLSAQQKAYIYKLFDSGVLLTTDQVFEFQARYYETAIQVLITLFALSGLVSYFVIKSNADDIISQKVLAFFEGKYFEAYASRKLIGKSNPILNEFYGDLDNITNSIESKFTELASQSDIEYLLKKVNELESQQRIIIQRISLLDDSENNIPDDLSIS